MSDNTTPQEQPKEEPKVEYEPWEETPAWPHIVAEPINTSGMLPRDARRLLEAAGAKLAKGVSVDALEKAIKGVKEG